jgi:EpsI family protein
MIQLLRSNSIRLLTVVLIAQAVLFYSASHGEITPLASPLSAFPREIGDYRLAQEGYVDQETLDVLKADDTLSRVYADSQGGASLFIAYFKTQRQGQSPHSPKNCLPGAGWQQDQSGKIDVQVPGETININRFVVSKGGNKSIVLYWYQSQGRVIADEFAAKFYLIANSIQRRRSDTALVRVVVGVPPGEDKRAEAVGLNFVRAAYPAVKAYLPQ